MLLICHKLSKVTINYNFINIIIIVIIVLVCGKNYNYVELLLIVKLYVNMLGHSN